MWFLPEPYPSMRTGSAGGFGTENRIRRWNHIARHTGLLLAFGVGGNARPLSIKKACTKTWMCWWLGLLGSFRLQSTCRYQRSREDVCPQHKATGHVSKYVNSRCAIENCLMSARNIRATAHAPCSQHTFNRNLELKTDQFHGVYRLVTPST